MLKKLKKLPSLFHKTTNSFAGLNLKRKPTRKDLDHYEVIVVGGNFGGIFSRHFDQVTHGHHKMMAVFDQPINQQYSMRVVYEQQRATKTEYLPNSKLAINMYTAHSDNIGVEEFLPQKNQIVLRNGRTIGYDWLVIAMGLQEDFDSIKNFEQCWQDQDHPVFTCKDHHTWRAFQHKYYRYIYHYNHGDAYFCIPPYPFSGEVNSYNFFVAQEIWKWYENHGKLSPKNSFTIINANDRFVQHLDSADNFIKEECNKRGINIVYGKKLVQVNQENQTAIFEDCKTKQRETKPYNNLYSMIPTKPHENLVKSGLASKESNFLLDVDQETLQHKKYKNIFGLGDCVNLPTTKSFWGAFHQVSVVRNNLDRAIKGKNLNALYDGYSKVPLILGQNKMTYVVHFYDQKEGQLNLFAKNGGIIAILRYLYWGKLQRRRFLGYYLFKTWGPPYYKFMRRFKELPPNHPQVLKQKGDNKDVVQKEEKIQEVKVEVKQNAAAKVAKV